MLGYFHDRDAYERRDLKTFTQSRLIQFRDDRARFSAVEYERMFEEWKHGGDGVVIGRSGVHGRSLPCSSDFSFESHLLPFNYQLFGTLGDGNWRGRAS